MKARTNRNNELLAAVMWICVSRRRSRVKKTSYFEMRISERLKYAWGNIYSMLKCGISSRDRSKTNENKGKDKGQLSGSWFRASAITTMNKKPTRFTIVLKSLKFYCVLIPFYMFRALLRPSSGAS
jgi:hypothetical protein